MCVPFVFRWCRARISVGYVLRPLDGPSILLRLRPGRDETLLVQTVDTDRVRQDVASSFGVFAESRTAEQEEELLAYLARATAAA
eukprot:COSAG02_NODE_9175_length_2301_cov_6.934151_2_plen_85_part_00